MTELVGNLQKSSEIFLQEAITNAVDAAHHSHDHPELRKDRWLFAVLHLVTSIELVLKAHLCETNSYLIRQNIDKPGGKPPRQENILDEPTAGDSGYSQTVSLTTAINRIRDPEICGTIITDKDIENIRSAVLLRNQIAHGALDKEVQAIEAKFFAAFAFARSFYFHHRHKAIDTFAEKDRLRRLLEIEKATHECEKKARNDLVAGEEPEICCSCGKPYFVIRNDRFTCLYCQKFVEAFECVVCSRITPQYDRDGSEHPCWHDAAKGIISREDFLANDNRACRHCSHRIDGIIEDANLWDHLSRDSY